MKLLLTHIADMDGISPIILMNICNFDFQYECFDVKQLDKFIEDRIDSDYFDKYEEIIITDLSIRDELASKINKKYSSKFKLFDHHETAKYLNKYSYAFVKEEINGFKECATTLFYKYLIDTYDLEILKKDNVILYVELVRENDTYDFTELREESDNLNNIYNFFGNDEFIDTMSERLKLNSDFFFSDIELKILRILNENKKKYLESQKDKVIIKKIDGYRIGFVYAEQYRSELGDYLGKIYYDEVDFIGIINFNRHISFRGVKDDIKINEFAEIYDGGGHPKACAMPLKDEIKDKIIEEIFNANK